MKIGDLARCKYTGRTFGHNSKEVDGYFDVYAVGTGKCVAYAQRTLGGDKMKVGTLVKIKETENTTYLNKLAIVMNNGTWSVDVRLIDSNRGWWPRIAKDKLEDSMKVGDLRVFNDRCWMVLQ